MTQAGVGAKRLGEIVETTRITGPVSVLDSFECPARDYIRQVCEVLQTMGFGNVSVDLGVVRGLAYYTGMVFEVDAPKLGAEKQICGGGSYSLTELFGGERVFSTGFAIGFDRTLLALQTEGVDFPQPRLTAYVVPVNDKVRERAIHLVSELRRAGVSADMDLMRRSVGKNLKYADAVNARYAIIIGEKEMESCSVTIRDLSSGEQVLVNMADVVTKLMK